VINQEAPTQQGDRAENHPKSYFSRLFSPENLPNIGLFVAGVVGIVVAICTLVAIQRQAKANVDTLAEIRAAGQQTDRLIEHAGKQANAALLNAEAVMHSERAWIVVKPSLIDNKLQASPPHTITLFTRSIKNVGRTPATLVKTDAAVWRVSAADMRKLPEPPRYIGEPLSLNNLLLVPGDSIPITWMIEPAGEPLTAEEVAKIKGMVELTLFAYGFVEYLDIFNDSHTTRFCHTYVVHHTGKEGFEVCTFAPPGYSRCD
jgi:hypothetical protein